MTLGERDLRRQCRPRALQSAHHDRLVARQDVFVSDGYANSRVVKFDKNGKPVMWWGGPKTGASRAGSPSARHRRGRRSPRMRFRPIQPAHQVFDENGLYLDHRQRLLPLALDEPRSASMVLRRGPRTVHRATRDTSRRRSAVTARIRGHVGRAPDFGRL